MYRVNRDTVAAIALLVLTGVFFAATFDIRTPDYGTLGPATWPRIVLGILAALVLIYLVQSVRRGAEDEDAAEGVAGDAPEDGPKDGPKDAPEDGPGDAPGWRNVYWCFALFLAYLLTLPWLGMLAGGMAFVFLLLSVLGGWTPRRIAIHAAIAVLTVGGMWGLFTYVLDVFLPRGELFGTF